MPITLTSQTFFCKKRKMFASTLSTKCLLGLRLFSIMNCQDHCQCKKTRTPKGFFVTLPSIGFGLNGPAIVALLQNPLYLNFSIGKRQCVQHGNIKAQCRSSKKALQGDSLCSVKSKIQGRFRKNTKV